VATARLAASTHLALRHEAGTSMGATSVAAGRRGDGTLALFGRDETYRLHWRTDGAWQTVPGLQTRGAVRVAERGNSSITAFVADHDARLIEITVPLTGDLQHHTHDVRLRRVHAAAAGPGGRPHLVGEALDEQLLCGPPTALTPVGLSDIDAAALCTNDYDELVCVAARPGAREVDVIATPGGKWIDRERHDAPSAVPAVACAGLRTGLALALGTDDGLWVAVDDPPDWTQLWPGPVSHVVLSPGTGWRLQVAALSDGEVLYAEEITAGTWPRTATHLGAGSNPTGAPDHLTRR
jgi:hypothetical protein